jgi:hypothetical protein
MFLFLSSFIDCTCRTYRPPNISFPYTHKDVIFEFKTVCMSKFVFERTFFLQNIIDFSSLKVVSHNQSMNDQTSVHLTLFVVLVKQNFVFVTGEILN